MVLLMSQSQVRGRRNPCGRVIPSLLQGRADGKRHVLDSPALNLVLDHHHSAPEIPCGRINGTIALEKRLMRQGGLDDSLLFTKPSIWAKQPLRSGDTRYDPGD